MKFVHCETHQGAIAAVHIEFPTRKPYNSLPVTFDVGVISPVVMTHFGETAFLPSVDTVAEAIASARAHIERENKLYINQVLDDQIPASEAIQHFEDCAIPLEMVPTLVTERPYYPPHPLLPIGCLLPQGSRTRVIDDGITVNILPEE